MTTIRAFSQKLGQFFPIFENGKGRPPSPYPLSSYAPALPSHILQNGEWWMEVIYIFKGDKRGGESFSVICSNTENLKKGGFALERRDGNFKCYKAK